MKVKFNHLFLALAMGAALTVAHIANAKQGATDPIPGTSNGTASSGGIKSGGGKVSGGGSKSTTPTPTPAPAPAPQPIITAPLTFSSSGQVGGNCNGSYRIDPYYPTLSLMTVTVSLDSMQVSDNSLFHVDVVTAGGTAYPFTSNQILVNAGAGTVSYSIYVTPGTTLSGVTVSDSLGNIDFAGN